MKFILVLLLAILMIQCAQVEPLTGGPKDVTSPRIDSTKTYPTHQQLNFDGESMVITFDEFVSLKSPANNITITPTFSEEVQYSLKGKKLIVDFPEKPLPNTTYRLTIDGGIVDYTEGNDSLYTFVFSSGDYIDSAQLFGKVLDGYTNEPIVEAYVLFYDVENLDSIQNRRANYFTKTAKDGTYKIENIKPGQYEIIALEDQNQSRSYDLITEPVGFSSEKLYTVLPDSNTNFDLYISKPLDTAIYIKNVKQRIDGALAFGINNWKNFDEVVLTNLSDSIKVTRDQNFKDSIVLWPNKLIPGNLSVEVKFNNQIDTISFITKAFDNLKHVTTNNLVQNKLLPDDTLSINSNFPIAEVDTSLIYLYKDTIRIKTFAFNIQNNSLKVLFPFKDEDSYSIILDSAAIKSIYNTVNDSTKFNFSLMLPTEYASIIIDIDSTFISNGFVELYNNEKKVLRKKSVTEGKVTFNNLLADKYYVRFVEDKNNNNKWDAGDYTTRKLPEKVYYLDQTISPKKGWEHKTIWRVDSQ